MPDAMRRFCLFIHTYDSCSNRLTDMSCRLSHFTLIADSHFSFFRSHKHLISACMAAMADAFDSLLFVGGDDISDAMAFRSIQLFLVWLPLFCPPPPKEGIKKTGLTPVWNICKMHVFYPDWPVLIPASAFLISSHNNYAVNFGYRCLPCRHS